ncbi:OmpA family protein [Hyunsoonleella sp. SJ7]|uniref:OmpA family protein n=1 Tax=Hyunsoonleella aquatilis TaxID=2762758 RepID=A0A923HCE2_9FLAO|nr:OmpA family protein [Hyunsoonleella aquatilis]MBC3757498.1 OmpA family protein [Hyunsoonleella aquatilis]
MKHRIYILSILFALVFNSSFSQKGKASKAIKAYEKLSYVASRSDLLELASKENASPEVIEKLANTFYLNSEMVDASKWYDSLIALSPETHPENYFRFGMALKAQEKYDEAEGVLVKFALMQPEDSRAKAILNAPNYLRDIENNSKDYELRNLNINTEFSDFGASIYNGNLIFASSRDVNEKIYGWNAQPFLDIFKIDSIGNVTEVLGKINTKYHESSTAFTKDGKTVYFTRNNYFKKRFKKNSEDTHALKIYKATLADGIWTNIESLPFNSDEYSVAHPALSVEEDKLYFASDMPGTFGSSDIFVVDINDDGTYGKVVNLGPNINTEGRENFPFISDKGMLYFSSDGHVGLGGLDVFKIDVEHIYTGTGVKNLAKPINSPKDDFSFVIDEASGKGYISSNRKGGKGDDDIYSFEMPECTFNVSGTVIDKRTKEILPNTKVILSDTNNNIIESRVSDGSGKFAFTMGCNDATYIVEGKKENYNDDFIDFSVDAEDITTLKLELKLEPKVAEVGTDLFKLLNLNPIYFDYDKSFIRPDAEIELAKIINYMKQYPNVKVDVRSHTDSRGRDAYNFALSNRRNKSTIAYIINNGGISANRLSGKGYGETQLTNHCSNGVKCSKEEHQANRRSEFIVVEN